MMRQQTPLFVAILLFFVAHNTAAAPEKKERKKIPFQVDYGDNTFRIENKIKLDSNGTVDVNKLNRANGDLDKTVIPGRFIDDFIVMNFFHNPLCGWDTARLKVGLRLRGTFGAPESSSRTGPALIRDQDSSLGTHVHPIAIHVPIIREIWGEFNLNELLGLSFHGNTTFTMGLFPFYLGRGIALGDAFSVVPDFIGYDPAMSVDQYAPGFKLSGTLWKKYALTYDFYAAITDNFSDTFANINVKNQGQFYGHRYNQARGFGVLNYLFAAHFLWKPVYENGDKFTVEPYILLDMQNCQKVEVPHDATSKLGTAGLFFDMTKGDVEFGFEVARNFGHQKVKGLDRNTIIRNVRTEQSVPSGPAGSTCMPVGDQNSLVLVNSHVVLQSDGKTPVPFNPCSSPTLQPAITAPLNGSTTCSCLSQYNGEVLDVELYDSATKTYLPVMNTPDRFRDPYVNHYTGWMFITDVAYRLRSNFKLAAMAAYASGDNDPNKDLDTLNDSSYDGEYHGFVGLQEVYSGNRVRSGFILGGVGRIPRLTWFPVVTTGDKHLQPPTNPYPSTLSRFTNIAFLGGAAWWEKEECDKKWVINPNVITYWQPDAPRLSRTVLPDGSIIECFAHNHLGTEINVYVDCIAAPGFKWFLVGGFFVPGGYFDDLKGIATSKPEQNYINYLNGKGPIADKVPLIGNNVAFFINLGLEYKF